MNPRQKYIGFCFALLLGILNISGVLAEEKPFLGASSEEAAVPAEIQKSSGNALFWISGDLPKISLSEYSKIYFQQGNFPRPCESSFLETRSERRFLATFLKRDLKQVIGIQLFPFHFFL